MNKVSWLDKFAELRAAKQNKKAKTASKKVVSAKEIEDADIAIINKSKLPNAKEGMLVKYKNCKWRVIDAAYCDGSDKEEGVVIRKEEDKTADISTRPINSPQDYARRNPGSVYDSDTPAKEQAHFEEQAKETAEEIAREDSVDHSTTPAARTVDSPLAHKSEGTDAKKAKLNDDGAEYPVDPENTAAEIVMRNMDEKVMHIFDDIVNGDTTVPSSAKAKVEEHEEEHEEDEEEQPEDVVEEIIEDDSPAVVEDDVEEIEDDGEAEEVEPVEVIEEIEEVEPEKEKADDEEEKKTAIKNRIISAMLNRG